MTDNERTILMILAILIGINALNIYFVWAEIRRLWKFVAERVEEK